MKKLIPAFLLVFSFLVSSPLFAEEQPLKSDFPTQITEVYLDTCPVMGGKINKSVNTIFENKLYYFCCAGCIKTFTGNIQKYSDKLVNAVETVLKVTNKDGKCPVTGLEAQLSFFKIDNEAKTITFYHDAESMKNDLK